MKVHQFIALLTRYNPEADVNVVVDGRPMEFELCCGSSEGGTPKTCDSVDLMVDTYGGVSCDK